MKDGRGRFARFKAWSSRLDNNVLMLDWQPPGLDLAQEPVRSEILKHARTMRMWLRPPIVVEDDGFVTAFEAGRLLKSRVGVRPAVGMLVARGFLQQAFRASDGAEGITRESVSAELQWRRSASFWRRLSRRLVGILHWL